MPIEFSELAAVHKPSTLEKTPEVAPKAKAHSLAKAEPKSVQQTPQQGDSRSVGRIEKPLAHTAADDLHTQQLQATHDTHLTDDELVSNFIAKDRSLLASEADTELKMLEREAAFKPRVNAVDSRGAQDSEGDLDTKISQAVADADPQKVYELEQKKGEVVEQEIIKDEEVQDQERAAALRKEEQEIQASRKASIQEQKQIDKQQAAVAKEHKQQEAVANEHKKLEHQQLEHQQLEHEKLEHEELKHQQLERQQRKSTQRKREMSEHDEAVSVKRPKHDDLLKRYGHVNLPSTPRIPEGQRVANTGLHPLIARIPSWEQGFRLGIYHNNGWHPLQHEHQGGQSISA